MYMTQSKVSGSCGTHLGPRSRDINNEKRRIKKEKRNAEEQIKGMK
jgi:hypothetical protein